MPGASMGMINLNEMLGQAFGGTHQAAAHDRGPMPTSVLIAEESDKLLDPEKVLRRGAR